MKSRSESTKHVCANCWAEEVTQGYLGYPAVANMPPGWGSVMIIRNEGVATNSLMCDQCLTDIQNALSVRRNMASVQAKIAAAKEAGVTSIKVTQVGTGREATIDISEFDHPEIKE